MHKNELWLLPDGVQELDNALSLEYLRRSILDLLHSHGYELVLPPLLEFLNSLLIGKGSQLELDTIKIIDQKTGKLLGMRADITPQIARIAAKSQQSRFCYVGDVAKARNIGNNRIPMQIGAELFGYFGIESDKEIINLMLQTLAVVTNNTIYLDIGHVGIFRSLILAAKLTKDEEQNLLKAVQKKSKQEVSSLLKDFKIPLKIATQILDLIDLHGGPEVLEIAQSKLDNKIVGNALTDLKKLTNIHPNIYFDLSELRGYSYHTGLIFAIFVDQSSVAVAQGGRYDKVGKIFGKDQGATGFSADLLTLTKITNNDIKFESISAPAIDDKNLHITIKQLRNEGKAVIQEFKDENNKQQCSHKLILKNNIWQIIANKIS